MLFMALPIAKELGIDRALVTCDKNNPASAKTILRCGGVLEDERLENGELVQRYWIYDITWPFKKALRQKSCTDTKIRTAFLFKNKKSATQTCGYCNSRYNSSKPKLTNLFQQRVFQQKKHNKGEVGNG